MILESVQKQQNDIMCSKPLVFDQQQPNGEWRIETLQSLAEIHAHAQEWLALERHSAAHFGVFQSYVWCESWAATFCPQRNTQNKPYIFLIYKGDILQAILPMMLTTHLGIKILTAFGEPHTQMASVICKKGVDCRKGLQLCFEQMAPLSAADVIAYGPFAHDDILVETVSKKYLSPDPAICYSVLTWDKDTDSKDYIIPFSKNRRRNLRRKKHDAQKLGKIEFKRYDCNHKEFGPLAYKAIHLKRQWLERKGIVSLGLAQQKTDDFLAELAPHDGDFQPEIDVLKIGGQLAAISINITGSAMKNCYLSTYDHDFSTYSPGNIITQHAIYDCMNRGLSAYNLLGYPSDFKDTWTNQKIPVLRYQKATTLKGKLWINYWVKRVRPMTKKAFSSLQSLFKNPVASKIMRRILSRT